MRLSENFHLSEFTRSGTATRKNINNIPGEQEVKNLTALVQNVLQPVRSKYGRVIYVSSGFRSEQLNRILGGAQNSQHIAGEAADVTAAGWSTRDFARAIIDAQVEFDQLIVEFPESPTGGWIHVSYTDRRENRNEILLAEKTQGVTVYASISPAKIALAV